MSAPKIIRNGEISIWGGQCGEAAALKLIEAWPTLARLPYRIWETAGEIAFEQATLPDNCHWIERARLFGEGGDLTLRRDGGDFRWWFVGPAGVELPQDLPEDMQEAWKQAEDFWVHSPDACFNEDSGTMLLWGERPPGKEFFWDDRVAGADLRYPGLHVEAAQRVEIEYVTYSRAGRVEFTWLRDLRKAAQG
jgi:hypothetical protein